MRPFGIVYLVTNVLDGRFYIGQTRRTLSHRWAVHRSEARRRPVTYFHKAIQRHGAENFEVQIVATAGDQDSLNRLEAVWVAVTGARHYGYNLKDGGLQAPMSETGRAALSARRRGSKASPETRARMSAARRGRPKSAAHRAAIAAALEGRLPSRACLEAVAVANATRQPSEATREKLRQASLRGNEVRWASRRSR